MAEKTIMLNVGDEPRRYEDKADGTIYPGYLIRVTSTGVNVQTSVGGHVGKLFAIENSLEGDDIGDAYVSGERVQYIHAKSGDEILAVLENGQNVARGGLLESNGDGQLQAYAADSAGAGEPDVPLAIAMEALNLSASANGDVLSERRIVVRII